MDIKCQVGRDFEQIVAAVMVVVGLLVVAL